MRRELLGWKNPWILPVPSSSLAGEQTMIKQCECMLSCLGFPIWKSPGWHNWHSFPCGISSSADVCPTTPIINFFLHRLNWTVSGKFIFFLPNSSGFYYGNLLRLGNPHSALLPSFLNESQIWMFIFI